MNCGCNATIRVTANGGTGHEVINAGTVVNVANGTKYEAILQCANCMVVELQAEHDDYKEHAIAGTKRIAKLEQALAAAKVSIETRDATIQGMERDNNGLAESIERVRGERDKYFKALTNHLCEYDIADWIACGGHGEFSCSACNGEAPHAHAEKLQAELSRLTQELAQTKAELTERTADVEDYAIGEVYLKLTRERDEAETVKFNEGVEAAAAHLALCIRYPREVGFDNIKEWPDEIRALKRPIQGVTI